MPWGAAIGAGLNFLGGKKSNGGAGTTTASKEPWTEVTPWLRQQIAEGQRLQDYYRQTPFSQAQTTAYGNLAQQGNYARALVPNLLGQLSGQNGFDRSNPRARPAGINFNPNGLLNTPSPMPTGLGQQMAPNPVTTTNTSYTPPPAAAPVAAPASPQITPKEFGQLMSDYNMWREFSMPPGGL